MKIGRNEIGILRRAGILPAGGYAAWARWARHALLALGLGHLLAGIVFFFAYNWAALPDLAKFAVVEAGIVTAAGTALWRGADRADGAAALIAATVLTGVLLAVIGQVYQTGAEAWQLFALWAGLALPWALASRNAAHWLAWLVVLHVAAALYADQVVVARGTLSGFEAIVAISLLPFLVLLLRELVVDRGQAWAASRWTRLAPAIAGLAGLATGAGWFLLEGADAGWRGDSGNAALAPVAFLAAVAALGGVYRVKRPDLGVLAAAIGFGALFLIAATGRILFDRIGFEETEALLSSLALLIFWSVAVVAGTAKLLEHLRRTMPAHDRG